MKRLLALTAVLTLAVPSVALAFGVIHATPSSVKPGHKVRLHGSVSCHNGDQVTLFSRAFKGSHQNFAGVPAVITTVHSDKYSVTFRIHKNVKKRTYHISGRCGGGLFGSGTLKVT
jgi:hypothetical protein